MNPSIAARLGGLICSLRRRIFFQYFHHRDPIWRLRKIRSLESRLQAAACANLYACEEFSGRATVVKL